MAEIGNGSVTWYVYIYIYKLNWTLNYPTIARNTKYLTSYPGYQTVAPVRNPLLGRLLLPGRAVGILEAFQSYSSFRAGDLQFATLNRSEENHRYAR